MGMVYDVKNVFYLDIDTVTISNGTAGAGSGQLDLSAYIDPIARGKTKGTGLAIYTVQTQLLSSGGGNEPVDENEVGSVQMGLIAGAGVGNSGTGTITLVDRTLCQANKLCIWSGSYYAPSNAGTADMTGWSGVYGPSEKVPYVIVRDNVCLIYDLGSTANWGHDTFINVRMECAQITLDQSTLNQLLRTQTV